LCNNTYNKVSKGDVQGKSNVLHEWTIASSIRFPETRFYSIQNSIFVRGIAGKPFEQAGKMLGIFETKFIGNFTNRFINVKNSFFSKINNFRLYIFLGSLSCFLFYQVTKVIG